MNFVWGIARVLAGGTGPAQAEEPRDLLESPPSWRSSPSIRVRDEPYRPDASSSSSTTPKEKRMPASLRDETQTSHNASDVERGEAKTFLKSESLSSADHEIEVYTSGSSTTPKKKRLPAKFDIRIQPHSTALNLEEADEETIKKEGTSNLALIPTASTFDVKDSGKDKSSPVNLFPSPGHSSAGRIAYPKLSKPSNGFGSALEDYLTTKFTSATSVHLDCLQSLPLKSHQVEGFEFLHNLEVSGQTGGILADDMGLGKTLQMIAVILSDNQIVTTQGHPSLTLIVMPLSLIPQWVGEFEKFAPSLKVLVHHRKTKLKGADDPLLMGAHVVITTYDQARIEHLAHETVDKTKESESHSPLFTIKWRRVILDEAQYIRNPEGKRSIACRALSKIFGHCVTGTPAQNKIDDLFPLLNFLRVPHLSDWSTFSRLVSEPAEYGQWYIAFAHLKNPLKIRLLRRTKFTQHNGKPILKLEERYTGGTRRGSQKLTAVEAVESEANLGLYVGCGVCRGPR